MWFSEFAQKGGDTLAQGLGAVGQALPPGEDRRRTLVGCWRAPLVGAAFWAVWVFRI